MNSFDLVALHAYSNAFLRLLPADFNVPAILLRVTHIPRVSVYSINPILSFVLLGFLPPYNASLTGKLGA